MGWRTILQAPRNVAGKVEKQARLIVGGNNMKRKKKKNLSLKVFQNRHTSVVTIKLQNHNESSLDLSTCLSILPLFT